MSTGRKFKNAEPEIINGLDCNVIYIIRTDDDYIFSGTLRSSAAIRKRGSGKLLIEGVVEEGFQLTISGNGEVIFKKRPPESVIHAIKNLGKGKVHIPNVNEAQAFNTSHILMQLDVSPQASSLSKSFYPQDSKRPGNLSHDLIHADCPAPAYPFLQQEKSKIYQAEISKAQRNLENEHEKKHRAFKSTF